MTHPMRLPLVVASICLIGHTSQSQTGSNSRRLRRASHCVAHGGGFAYAGGIALPSTVTMNNDGGWCGGLSYTTEGGHVFGVPMHLTKQPDHGEVSIRVRDKGTVVAYRPNPGFIGSDSFTVLNEMVNMERQYNVTVTK